MFGFTTSFQREAPQRVDALHLTFWPGIASQQHVVQAPLHCVSIIGIATLQAIDSMSFLESVFRLRALPGRLFALR
jgi:hypothetical protein